jgi:hypothetical protein
LKTTVVNTVMDFKNLEPNDLNKGMMLDLGLLDKQTSDSKF